MKIEVGKTYETRNKGLRKVVHERPDGRFLVVQPDRNITAALREADGSFLVSSAPNAFDLVEEYTPPVVEKLYTNVIEGVRDCAKYGFCVSDTKKQPVPYVDNDSFEQRAIIEVTVTDGKVTEAKLYESPEGDGK